MFLQGGKAHACMLHLETPGACSVWAQSKEAGTYIPKPESTSLLSRSSDVTCHYFGTQGVQAATYNALCYSAAS
jgi:hypothetical protein